jgi:hypothetical protein
MSNANEKLEARARAIRSHAVIHAWEMRQHENARGVSFEIERLFALTSSMGVDGSGRSKLTEMGRRPNDVGLRLQHSKCASPYPPVTNCGKSPAATGGVMRNPCI